MDEGLSWRTCAQDYYIPKNSIYLSMIWTRKQWVSRQPLYPFTIDVKKYSNELLYNKIDNCIK